MQKTILELAQEKKIKALRDALGQARATLRIHEQQAIDMRRKEDGLIRELYAANAYAIELLRELPERGLQGDNATAAAPIHVSDRENSVKGRKSGNNSISVATIKAALGDWPKYSGLDGPELESPAYLRGCSEYQGPEGALCQ